MYRKAFIIALAAAVLVCFALGIFSPEPSSAWFFPMFSLEDYYVENENGTDTVISLRFFGGSFWEFIKSVFR